MPLFQRGYIAIFVWLTSLKDESFFNAESQKFKTTYPDLKVRITDSQTFSECFNKIVYKFIFQIKT